MTGEEKTDDCLIDQNGDCVDIEQINGEHEKSNKQYEQELMVEIVKNKENDETSSNNEINKKSEKTGENSNMWLILSLS